MYSLKDGIGKVYNGMCHRIEIVATKPILVEIIYPIKITIESATTHPEFVGIFINSTYLISYTNYYRMLFNN